MFFFLNVLYNIIYFCDAKLNFHHHFFSVSHETLEIILICWFIINVGKSCTTKSCCITFSQL